MKKILKSLAIITILFTGLSAHAQTSQSSTDSAKAAKKAARAEKKAEKAKAAAAATTTAPAVTTPPAPAATPVVATPPAKPVKQAVNKTADKAVGTDAKGRTIYEGPKGGRYVLTAAGNKEYIKKTN